MSIRAEAEITLARVDDGQQGAKGDPGQPGTPGTNGADGFSPTVTTSSAADGSTQLSVTNKEGTTTTTLQDGTARASAQAAGAAAESAKETADSSVASVLIEYAVSTSASTFTPASGTKGTWSKDIPASPGDTDYVWQRKTVTLNNGTIEQVLTNFTGLQRDATARSQATSAAKVATNFLYYDAANGLQIGNKKSGAWQGYRTKIDSDSFDILDSDGNALASYGADLVELGKNSTDSIIKMCGNKAGVQARFGGIVDISSDNADYSTTLDFEFDKSVFLAKVGQEYGGYFFRYDSLSGWTTPEGYDIETHTDIFVPVVLSQYGITVHQNDINDGARINIDYYSGSHVKLFNTDTVTGSRKLEIELAEKPSTENTDYVKLLLERQTQVYESGDTNEHSHIIIQTVHDSGNVASIDLFDDEILISANSVNFAMDSVYDVWSNNIVGALVGEIKLFAGDSSELYEKWLVCDGSAVSRDMYPQLFRVIGTTYGSGDGSTTFNLPDLRERVPIGTSSSYALGAKGGEATHSLTTNEMPEHTHTASTASAGAHTHGINNCSAAGTGSPQLESYAKGNNANRSVSTKSAGAHTHTVTVKETGGGAAHNNMQPYLSMNYIIFTGAVY